MLAAIGAATLALISALITFYGALRVMESLGWWRDAGLAAFIPMFAVSVPLAIFVACVVVWLLR